MIHTVEASCPRCASVVEVQLPVRRIADEFCSECDYPLFFIPAVEFAMHEQPLVDEDGPASTPRRACLECGVTNAEGSAHCRGCGSCIEVQIAVQPPRLEVTSGVGATFEVEITNPSAVAGSYAVAVAGLDDAWVECDPAVLTLLRDQQGVVRVTLTLPTRYPAGQPTMVVRVEIDSSGRTCTEDLVLHVIGSRRFWRR